MGDESKEIPQVIKDALFSISPGHAILTPSKQGFYIVSLQKLEQPDPDNVSDQEKNNLHHILTSELQQLFMGAYIQTLMEKYPTTTNWDYISQMLHFDSSDGGGAAAEEE